MDENSKPLYETIDIVTRQRIGSLAARGIEPQQIADVLFLSIEQVISARDSIEYKSKYAEEADRIIQSQVDRDEAWDVIEEKSQEQILNNLKFSRDPKLALITAQIANKAIRRKNDKAIAQVIDATKVTNNITILHLNRNYIERRNETGVIDITPKPKEIAQRTSDLPSPKSVEEVLGNGVLKKAEKKIDEFMEDFKLAGVVFDSNE